VWTIKSYRKTDKEAILMRNIQDKTKKRLTIAGLGIVCVALVIAISS